jgi:hypothetical protein
MTGRETVTNASQPIDELYARWWQPADLKAECEKIMPADNFRGNEMKPAREAWVAAVFAGTRPWNLDWKVWLVPAGDEFPDFKLRRATDHDVRLFEIVEARFPPLPDDEFQGFRHEDGDEHFRAGLSEAAKQIRKKAKKGYSPRPHLIVYCNFYPREVPVEEARAQVETYRNKFESIWLVWGKTSVLIATPTAP